MTGWLAMGIGLAALTARASEVADRLTAAGIAEFTAAFQAWDGEGFGAAAERFRQASTNAPGCSTHFYWLGAGEFHTARKPAAQRAALATLLTAEALFEAEPQ